MLLLWLCTLFVGTDGIDMWMDKSLVRRYCMLISSNVVLG